MFLGFAVSDAMFHEVLSSDRGLPVQTQRFGWSVARALRQADIEVDLVSAEPRTDYPHNTRLIVRGRPFREGSVDGESISFVNFIGLKHLTRYASAQRVATRHGQTRPDAIIVHGVHSPFLWVGLRLGHRWAVPVITILTDAPSPRTAYDNRIAVALKAVDRMLIRRALGVMDGVIALAPTLIEELAPGRPNMLLEGIAPDLPIALMTDRPEGRPPLVVYAGGLHESYGVTDLLQSVRLAQAEWRLRIYGRGPAEAEILRAAERDERIEFAGSVTPDEMISAYAAADVLVNPRPPDNKLAITSFPSKLLEYLATGVPVVSTDLPTLPPDYRDHLTIARAGARGLAEAIDEVVRQDLAVRVNRGQRARAFILGTRGSKPQGLAIKAFIHEVGSAAQVRDRQRSKRP
jgi:glycosyltransferase involved in cell wall biosynthesis